MNVAFVTAEYPPKSIGGAGISSKLIVEGLSDNGHSVDVYALTGEDGLDSVTDKDRYHELPAGAQYGIPDLIGQNLSVYRHLPDTDQYDILHVYSPGHLPASVLRAEIPVVATFVNFSWVCINPERYHRNGCPRYSLARGVRLARSNGYSWLQSVAASALEKAGKTLAKRADAITVQTEGMRSLLSQCGYNPSNIDVVSNIVDPQFLLDTDGEAAKDPRRIITVGRLTEVKGVFDIIRSFTELPEEVKQGWRLEVYGEGPQREEIVDYLEDRHEERVSLDYCPYEKMPEQVYRGAAAVVHGAKWPEPFSRVWLEALATGTPIICTKNPSSRCVLEGIAEFYDAFDRDSLDRALRRVMGSKERRERLSELSRSAANRYEQYRVIPEYTKVYEQSRS